MSTIRVLMLTQFLGIGGLERMILNLSLSLKKYTNCVPEVFAYDQSYHDTMDAYMDDVFRESGIPVQGCRKKSGFSWKVVEIITAYCKVNQIRVVHTHDLGALIYGALVKIRMLGKIRLVHTQHSFVHLKRHFRYRIYERFFTLFADQIIVVSPDTKKSYIELGVKAEKIQIIPNGVEFAEIPPGQFSPVERKINREKAIQDSVAGKEFKDRLIQFQNSVWILYLARVHSGKGQDHALKVWNALNPEVRKQSVLMFVGPETFKGELGRLRAKIAESSDSERVIYTGPTQIPSLWISASDVFMSSSEFEGMPLAPYEAFGSGLPILLSDIPGHESLKGLADLYPLSNVEEGAQKLSQTIRKLTEDRSLFLEKTWTLGQPIRDQFSTQAMALSYASAYR